MTRWIEHECASLVLLCRHSRRLLAPMQGNTGYEWTAEQHELFLAQAAVFKNLSNPPGFIWAVFHFVDATKMIPKDAISRHWAEHRHLFHTETPAALGSADQASQQKIEDAARAQVEPLELMFNIWTSQQEAQTRAMVDDWQQRFDQQARKLAKMENQLRRHSDAVQLLQQRSVAIGSA